jgi:hypothetical protein
MELIQPKPAELIDHTPWLEYLSSITSGADAPEWTMAYGQLLAAKVPSRLLLWGPGNLIAASEFSLDLFRSLTTTISGLEPGGLEDDHAEIHYHPCLHRCDHKRLTDAVKERPNDSFLVVAVDMVIAGDGWLNAALNTACGIPWPALNLLRWLHSDFNLSDVSPRIEVLHRWAQKSLLHQSLKVVN